MQGQDVQKEPFVPFAVLFLVYINERAGTAHEWDIYFEIFFSHFSHLPPKS